MTVRQVWTDKKRRSEGSWVVGGGPCVGNVNGHNSRLGYDARLGRTG